ncbi:zwei Ig domain protein zig-8-like [Macrobrachium rosenbergii]|uniref:zwei Ig domain protein zig-8-like n=1 Tax=Macrobrachium rosenbergii TaxID=79674 RepID=UPI0034D4C4A1
MHPPLDEPGHVISSHTGSRNASCLREALTESFVGGPLILPIKSRSSSFVVVSEGQYDHAHHTHHAHEEHQSHEPHFASTNSTIDVYLGATATLDCTVHGVTNESISWLRDVDDNLELLTWESHTYSKDNRYSLLQESGDKWQRWRLVIKDAQVKDQGQYRCQVATQPPMLLISTLKVTEPQVQVVDERGTKVVEKHYNSGSMIELKCVIESVPFPYGHVTWKRGQETLQFNTSMGGISVRGDADTGYIRSRLYVANASPAHTGVYSCWYNNYSSDAVTVHVIAGENSAAMQHDKVPDLTSGGVLAINSPPRHFPSVIATYCVLSCFPSVSELLSYALTAAALDLVALFALIKGWFQRFLSLAIWETNGRDFSRR